VASKNPIAVAVVKTLNQASRIAGILRIFKIPPPAYKLIRVDLFIVINLLSIDMSVAAALGRSLSDCLIYRRTFKLVILTFERIWQQHPREKRCG